MVHYDHDKLRNPQNNNFAKTMKKLRHSNLRVGGGSKPLQEEV